ncbi:MAG TPA: PIG-L family deacetylase [Thermomicrobiales bacterium]|nr:PIG-L family deacetylase [Thermomicrobiales bacterium]
MPIGEQWHSFDRYLVVVAHPDDAEFSSAGTIAILTAMGKTVVIAQVTSGDKGTADFATATTQMVTTRESEEIEAARRLGVLTVDFLRQTDGELMPDLALRGAVVAAVRRHKPDVIITHDPFRPYAFHPDHRAVGFAAHDAAYPSARDPHAFPELTAQGLEPHKTAEVWYFNAEHPDLVVDITGTMERKIDALKAHFSQVGENEEVWERVRERARDVAKDEPFEFGEAYKVVQLRR